MTLTRTICGTIGIFLVLVAFNPSGETHSLKGSPRHKLALDKFENASSKPIDEMLRLIGPPNAHYHRSNQEYWLYGNVVKIEKRTGKKLSPEVIIRNGKGMQTNWHPTDRLKKSIAIAKTFGAWSPPKTIKEKRFFLKDTNAVGLTKAQLIKKLGQPDAKWVFSGTEVWTYEKVRQDKKHPKHLTILFHFNGDKVIYSMG